VGENNGVDIFIPDDLKEMTYSNKKLCDRIELIKKIVGNSKKVLVILDFHHTHDHVLKELNLYEQFVKKSTIYSALIQ
tara:strand:- start:696 stop:929 length:234 start_codon:yes stop_codon:yes gene_type:complete